MPPTGRAEPGLEWYERIRHAAERGHGCAFVAEEVEALWERVRAPDPVRLRAIRARHSRRGRESRAREKPNSAALIPSA